VAAAKWAGIDRIGTLTFRHSFRSWLDSIGTPNCAAADADASFGHQNHDEHLRRRDARGHAERAWTAWAQKVIKLACNLTVLGLGPTLSHCKYGGESGIRKYL
jgi:integrase